MKYTLEVEKHGDVTDVTLRIDGGIRRFVCCENEMIHFSVHDGQLVFAGHSVRPPQSFYGPGLGVISP